MTLLGASGEILVAIESRFRYQKTGLNRNGASGCTRMTSGDLEQRIYILSIELKGCPEGHPEASDVIPIDEIKSLKSGNNDIRTRERTRSGREHV